MPDIQSSGPQKLNVFIFFLEEITWLHYGRIRGNSPGFTGFNLYSIPGDFDYFLTQLGCRVGNEDENISNVEDVGGSGSRKSRLMVAKFDRFKQKYAKLSNGNDKHVNDRIREIKDWPRLSYRWNIIRQSLKKIDKRNQEPNHPKTECVFISRHGLHYGAVQLLVSSLMSQVPLENVYTTSTTTSEKDILRMIMYRFGRGYAFSIVTSKPEILGNVKNIQVIKLAKGKIEEYQYFFNQLEQQNAFGGQLQIEIKQEPIGEEPVVINTEPVIQPKLEPLDGEQEDQLQKPPEPKRKRRETEESNEELDRFYPIPPRIDEETRLREEAEHEAKLEKRRQAKERREERKKERTQKNREASARLGRGATTRSKSRLLNAEAQSTKQMDIERPNTSHVQQDSGAQMDERAPRASNDDGAGMLKKARLSNSESPTPPQIQNGPTTSQDDLLSPNGETVLEQDRAAASDQCAQEAAKMPPGSVLIENLSQEEVQIEPMEEVLAETPTKSNMNHVYAEVEEMQQPITSQQQVNGVPEKEDNQPAQDERLERVTPYSERVRVAISNFKSPTPPEIQNEPSTPQDDLLSPNGETVSEQDQAAASDQCAQEAAKMPPGSVLVGKLSQKEVQIEPMKEVLAETPTKSNMNQVPQDDLLSPNGETVLEQDRAVASDQCAQEAAKMPPDSVLIEKLSQEEVQIESMKEVLAETPTKLNMDQVCAEVEEMQQPITSQQQVDGVPEKEDNQPAQNERLERVRPYSERVRVAISNFESPTPPKIQNEPTTPHDDLLSPNGETVSEQDRAAASDQCAQEAAKMPPGSVLIENLSQEEVQIEPMEEVLAETPTKSNMNHVYAEVEEMQQPITSQQQVDGVPEKEDNQPAQDERLERVTPYSERVRVAISNFKSPTPPEIQNEPSTPQDDLLSPNGETVSEQDQAAASDQCAQEAAKMPPGSVLVGKLSQKEVQIEPMKEVLAETPTKSNMNQVPQDDLLSPNGETVLEQDRAVASDQCAQEAAKMPPDSVLIEKLSQEEVQIESMKEVLAETPTKLNMDQVCAEVEEMQQPITSQQQVDGVPEKEDNQPAQNERLERVRPYSERVRVAISNFESPTPPKIQNEPTTPHDDLLSPNGETVSEQDRAAASDQCAQEAAKMPPGPVLVGKRSEDEVQIEPMKEVLAETPTKSNMNHVYAEVEEMQQPITPQQQVDGVPEKADNQPAQNERLERISVSERVRIALACHWIEVQAHLPNSWRLSQHR